MQLAIAGYTKKRSTSILSLKHDDAKSHLNIADPAKGSKLKYEALKDRIKTFKLPPTWEGPVDSQLMAEAGFVFTGQEDLVSCSSCNITLDRWTKDMDPLLRHKEEGPTCSFVRQKLQAVKGEKGKSKSVVAPSKPLNPRLTSSIGQLRSVDLIVPETIHTVVTGLNESPLSYGSSVYDHPGASLPITLENYQSETARMESFNGWPLNEAVHPEQLARVGFVYTGEGTLVQCFHCGVKYRQWYKGDMPLNVHQKCNPRCPYLQTLTSKSKFTPTELEQRPSKLHINPESLPLSSTQGEQVSKHSLVFPDYSDQATRLQSFKYWGGVLPSLELAEAGFYMIARRDVVRCHSCNVVAQDWERSDNVISEHRRFSPSCSFLKQFLSNMAKGESTLKSREVQAIQLPTTSQSTSTMLPPTWKSRGSSKSPGDQDETIQGICYPPSWGQNEPLSSPGISKRLSDDSDESFHSADSHHKSDYNVLTSLDQPIAKTNIMYEETLSESLENNIIIKSNDNTEDVAPGMGLCQICFVNQINCMFLPCGHARTCEECATRIKNSGQPCPYCRREVATTHHVYL